MKIKFWGTRGSIPVPGKDTNVYGGNTTCLELTLQSSRKVIIDAGTGIRALGEKLISGDARVDIHLLMTHIHWDHILGFPFFAPLYDPSTKIRIDGYPTCMKGLRSTFDSKMGDGFFPIKFDEIKAELKYLDHIKQGELEIDGAVIGSVPLQHPQGGFGFRFREGGRTLVFITDNELREDAWEDRQIDTYAEFSENADLLIHDCQYTPQEIDSRVGWGHSDYQSVVDLAHRAKVKKLILFHHDPSRKDPEVVAIKSQCEQLAKERSSSMIIEAAKEESELEL
jgi:phosphoribosyl 1,2-cyclic phosphodiesterase